jgi:DNA (cytosine-5)-methyltransferase 1
MASGKNAVSFKPFNEALARSPETYGDIDILCGGWPCQDNSIAGTRKGHAGEKSGLFSEFCRVLRIFNPRWFIGENVPGLLSVNAGKDFCQVLSIFQDIGYGVSWRILDSQYFGVPQQRRRLFIIGYFGNPCPPEILFEPKGDTGNHKKVQTMGKVGLCLSTRDGQRQDPSTENIVAFCLGTDLRGQPYKLHTETLCATTVRTQEAGNRIQGNIATTIDPEGKGTIAGIARKLDSARGVVIGNAVTVQVAEWIGKRIINYETQIPPQKFS